MKATMTLIYIVNDTLLIMYLSFKGLIPKKLMLQQSNPSGIEKQLFNHVKKICVSSTTSLDFQTLSFNNLDLGEWWNNVYFWG